MSPQPPKAPSTPGYSTMMNYKPQYGYRDPYQAMTNPYQAPTMKTDYSTLFGSEGNLTQYEGKFWNQQDGWNSNETMATGGVKEGRTYGNLGTDNVAKPGTAGWMGTDGKFDFGQGMGTVNSAMDVATTGINIYNAIQSNKFQKEYLAMAREESARAGEQWDITKQELGRIAAVRENLTAGYSTGNYAEQEANNPSKDAAPVSTIG